MKFLLFINKRLWAQIDGFHIAALPVGGTGVSHSLHTAFQLCDTMQSDDYAIKTEL